MSSRLVGFGSGTPTTHQQTITQLLQGAAAGSDSAAAQLLPVVYNQLHALASAFFRDQKPGNTLQPTALVHEAYLKLVDQTGIDWTGRKQFFALASKAMRSILVDHARSKGALKRGGDHQRIPLDEADRTPTQLDELTVLAIDEAMVKLAALDERKAQLVELRFFGGLNADEAADVIGIARSTAADEWRLARAWLYRELGDGSAS